MPSCEYPATMSTLLTAEDLAERYGQLVTLEQLARWFGQSARAVRARLRANGIRTIAIGDQEFVQLPVLEAMLGLENPKVLAGQAMAQRHRKWLVTHPDGRPRTVEELQVEVARGAAARRTAIARS
jgi:hypothetical protein